MSGINKSQRHQQFACDRCRGQKLRCIRGSKAHSSCERCEKAGAICVVDPSIRMGRPRTAKEQTENNLSSSNPLSTRGQSCGSIVNDAIRDETLSLHASKDMTESSVSNVEDVDFLDYDPIIAGLEGHILHQTSTDYSIDEYFNLGSHTGIGTCEASCRNVSASPLPAMQAYDESNPIDDARERPRCKCCSQAEKQGESATYLRHIEHLSHLNLELSQRLATMDQPGKEAHIRANLSDSIVSMIQGLQKFRELLLKILGYPDNIAGKEKTANQPHACDSRHNQPVFRGGLLKDLKQSLASSLSLTTSRSTGPVKILPGLCSTGTTRSSSDYQNSSCMECQTTVLDTPTSLPIISCYINLIRVSREVFAAVRDAVRDTSPIDFPLLPGFQNTMVPICQEADLQIILLIQVVLRLIEQIGLSLTRSHGHISEAMVESGACYASKTISHRLLNAALSEENKGGQPSCLDEIRVLREEIREINSDVLQLV